MPAQSLATSQHKSGYGYIPTEWICILFIVLFSVSSILHAGQAVKWRIWWLLATPCVAGILEIIGWAGRLWSHMNPGNINPYIMQMTATIIAPTFLIAANFVTLGQIIRRIGQQYSRLSAMWYTIVFTSCDVIALIIQAIGGATAATAVQNNNNPTNGGNIMLGGISFQMAAITLYMLLAAEFVLRFLWDRPLRNSGETQEKANVFDRKMKLMLAALTASSIFIYIRSVYRTIELANGWTGVIITTQWYFDVFDGAMVVLAMYTLNFLHPGMLLGPAKSWLSIGRKSTQTDDKRASSDSA
ncbi:RTA1 like protein-domain-containing protein [Amylocystis lapponica]|nr:RTA1 like protein-domain-containing protein [Amylocystis lapponica]